MRRLVILLIAACGDTQGSDLDGDGLADDEDECVAGFPDEVIDADGDGKDATQDLCPHDKNALAGDLDFDGIPDACDPFPAVTGGDTRRCITGFRVGWMNASHLDARDGEMPWTLRAPPRANDDAPPPPALVATPQETVSIVSAFPLEHASVTFDLVGDARFTTVTSTFKLWVRANPDAPSAQDLACGIDTSADGTQHLFVWSQNMRQAVVDLTTKIDGPFRLRATVQDISTHTVLCRVIPIGATTGQATRLSAGPIAGGRYGFAASAIDATIESLVIDSNEVAQPF